MGVHARRAARRTTPLVAAAAGIGTVAAMLASPLPASAASYIADSTYGKVSTSDPNIDRAARGGFTDTLGIDAVVDGMGNRYVLGQRIGGSDPRPIRITAFDPTGNRLTSGFGTAGVATFLGGSGTGGNPAIPATFTATKLVTDGTDLYVVGTARAQVVVIKVLANGSIAASYGNHTPTANGVAMIADPTNMPEATFGTGVFVADAEVSATGVLDIAIQASSTTGTRRNAVAQLDAGGALDSTYNTTGWADLPPAVQTAVSMGGITVLAGGAIAGTAQVYGSTSDSQSLVYELTPGGVPATFGTGGQSLALETLFDSSSFRWSGEELADVVEDTNTPGNLMVAGRAGNQLFLAALTSTGTVNAAFNDTGVSDTVTSACNTGSPEFAGLQGTGIGGSSGPRYWLSNDCGSIGEVVRWRTNGAADVEFGGGGMVRLNGNEFGYNGSVTAEPITVAGNDVIVGAGTVSNVASQPQYDIAGWRIVALSPAAITAQPTSVSTAAVSGTASFTVGVTGSPTPTVQWQAAAPGTENWFDLSNGAQPLFSAPATLAITGTPAIISQPANQSVAIDSHSASFTVGYLGDPPVTAMWEMKAAGGDWMPATGGNISISSGANSTTLAVTRAMSSNNGTWFRVTLTNALGRTVSLPATLEVTGIPNHPEPTPGESNPRGDYNGDGKTDFVSFRDGKFMWSDGTTKTIGKAGDWPVVGNFDSDDADDAAVYRPSTGQWIVDGQDPIAFGRSGDTPVAGDYNGDGKTEPAVFRPSNGMWYVQGMAPIAFGRSTDMPVAADYNGDGKTDIAVYRPSSGTWYVRGGQTVAFGRASDVPVPADYDGDGSADIALYRPSAGTWYFWGGQPVAFGRSTDVPAPADYNGDGKTDLAVYRPSTATYYVQGKSGVQVGNPGDKPLPR